MLCWYVGGNNVMLVCRGNNVMLVCRGNNAHVGM